MAIIQCPNCGSKNRVDENRAAASQPVCGKCGQVLELGAHASRSDSHPIAITDSNFESIVADSRPVLVDFWAEWCPPCRAIAPILEQLSSEADGKYVIAKLNVDENQQSAGRFHIEGIPTLLIFKSGQLVDRLVGAHPKNTIVQHLQAQL